MLAETIACDNCKAPVKIGSAECANCGRSFIKKWRDLRNGNPRDSVYSMQLATLEAEQYFPRLSRLYHRAHKQGKHLSMGAIRRVVEASVRGSHEYRQFVADLVVNMIEATTESE